MSPLGRCGLGFQQLQQEMLCTFLAKSGYCTALKKSLLDRIISCYQTAIVEVNLVLVCYPSQKCVLWQQRSCPSLSKKYVFMVLSCHILYYINSILFFCTNEMISLRRLLILEASEDLKKEVFVSMKNNYISKMFFCFLYPSKQFDCILSLLYLVEVTFSIMSLFLS